MNKEEEADSEVYLKSNKFLSFYTTLVEDNILFAEVYLSIGGCSAKTVISLYIDIDESAKVKKLTVYVNGAPLERLRKAAFDANGGYKYIEILNSEEDNAGSLCLDAASFKELFREIYKRIEIPGDFDLQIEMADRGADYLTREEFKAVLLQ